MEATEQEIENTDTTTSTDTSIFCNKDIPIGKLIELRSKKLSYQQIADIVKCDRSNVYRRLQPHIKEIDGLKSFKDNKADVIAVYQQKLLNSLTEEEIKRMPPGTRLTAFGILYDKERLERGQSTENIAYNDLTKTKDELEQMLKDRGWTAPDKDVNTIDCSANNE